MKEKLQNRYPHHLNKHYEKQKLHKDYPSVGNCSRFCRILNFTSTMTDKKPKAVDTWLHPKNGIEHLIADTPTDQDVTEVVLDPVRVGMLRQWINEDRIINNPTKRLITNEDIVFWLTPKDPLPAKE